MRIILLVLFFLSVAAMAVHPPRGSTMIMTLLVTAVVVSLVSRATAQGAFCIPDGWQSGRAITLAVSKDKGKPTITRNMGDVIYSTSQKKIWIDEDTFASDSPRVTRLYDYPGKILYTIRGENGETEQTCTQTPLPGPFVPVCVPENATMTHYKSYYGLPLPYVEFFKEFEGKENDVNYRTSLTYDDTPLFHRKWGKQNGETFFLTEEFYNSTIWGTMPADTFKPPAICRPTNATQLIGRSIDDVIRPFVISPWV
ncbi:uncharacterized protein [Littorina saxatilis]|uniref:uncharacterized protein isoform X2 n=1 Tax=Littorina saxatilis TaxID=31220 RepID=UPI0038B4F9AD